MIEVYDKSAFSYSNSDFGNTVHPLFNTCFESVSAEERMLIGMCLKIQPTVISYLNTQQQSHQIYKKRPYTRKINVSVYRNILAMQQISFWKINTKSVVRNLENAIKFPLMT